MSARDIPAETSEFEELLNGQLHGILSWSRLADFWAGIDPAAGWYLYAVGEPVPQAPAAAAEVARFMDAIDALLRRDHDEDYCGIVYADRLENPNLIKIYDPGNLGVSCGSSKTPPLPGWIMSRVPPQSIERQGALPGNRKRWWQQLFSRR